MEKVCQTGFILTKQCQDKAKGIELTLWLKTALGASQVTVSNERAVLFIHTEQHQQAIKLLNQQRITIVEDKALTLKTFKEQRVTALYFQYLRDFYSAREQLKLNGITCFEDDIRPDERYLMERFITDSLVFEGDKVANVHNSQVINARCKKADSNIELNVISIDIECSFDGDLYSIGLYGKLPDNQCIEKVLMIGQAPATLEHPAHQYMQWLDDEKQLLLALLHWIDVLDPDVFIGWNVINFDFDLLQKRFDLYGIPFAIGRDKSNTYWRKNRNSEQKYLEIAGRVVIDGIDLMKTATYNFPSFSLDNVARELLGEQKQVDDVDNRLAEINYNFHHNKEALAEYNLQDCKLVSRIFEHTDLMAFAMLRAKLTGLAMDRIGGSVAAFTNLYLPKLHRAGYVAPNLGDGESGLVSPGGYVMDSIPGLYKNVLVLDFKSLYPSIIRTFNIDPMGLIEGLKAQKNAIPGFDGAYFSRERHFLPAIITELWQERDKAKREKNSALSQAIKIIMNSFYGILGSTGCRFFDPRLSGSITKRSHALLKTTKVWIEELDYQVIYGDTDSIFVAIGEQHDEQASRAIGDQLAQLVNDKWQAKISDEFQLTSQLEIEFETHFSHFFMPTIRGQEVGTKKRYAGIVTINGEQNLRFKGLESVRTDWTQLAKDFQRALYLKVFNNEPVADYIIETVNHTRQGLLDDKLIYRKRIRRKLSDYQKNVPPHIKAARAADDKNTKLGKKQRYQKRGTIEYVMTVKGPQAIEYLDAPIDYDLYVERQLKAVANAILPFIDLTFEQITDQQLDLFL